jgi:hypothetical protein
MPQHAVTNGYEKREYLRAHPIADSRVVKRNGESSVRGLIEGNR